MQTNRKPLDPALILGLLALLAGLLAWVWLGDWRWAATGLAALLACAVLGAE